MQNVRFLLSKNTNPAHLLVTHMIPPVPSQAPVPADGKSVRLFSRPIPQYVLLKCTFDKQRVSTRNHTLCFRP